MLNEFKEFVSSDLSSYMNNSEFDLLDMVAKRTLVKFPTDNSTLWPMVVIKIRMNRRPMFYAFNHLLPCVLITLMSLLGFFMPPETGEKINMLTTVRVFSLSLPIKTFSGSNHRMHGERIHHREYPTVF